VQHGDGKQAVGQHRGGNMRLEGKQTGIFQLVRRREELRQQHGHRRQGQHQRLQPADGVKKARHRIHQQRQPDDQRQRVGHAQVEPAIGKHILGEQVAVQSQRDQHQMPNRPAAHHIPLASPLRPPEIGGQHAIGGGSDQ
jgi:hypothetical protein